MKKLSKMLLILSLLPLVIAACGGGLGSPEDASKAFFSAAERQDADALKDASCEEIHDFLPDFKYGDDDKVDLNFDLVFEEDDVKGSDAIVKVFGRVDIRVSNDDYEQELKYGSRDDDPIAYLRLKKDGDDWKVCDLSEIGLWISADASGLTGPEKPSIQEEDDLENPQGEDPQ